MVLHYDTLFDTMDATTIRTPLPFQQMLDSFWCFNESNVVEMYVCDTLESLDPVYSSYGT